MEVVAQLHAPIALIAGTEDNARVDVLISVNLIDIK
jgi:hypothetical protein